MTFDAHVNFGYSVVLAPPSPPASGTSLILAAGGGALMPTAPFNAVVWPVGALPLGGNAEVVRVTAISTDTLTIVRQQEGSSARAITVGDQFSAAITAKTLTDVETQKAQALTVTAQQLNANYNANPGELAVMGATTTSPIVTLPTAPADKTVCGAYATGASFTHTITFAVGSGDSINHPVTINANGQVAVYQYRASNKTWYATASFTLPANALTAAALPTGAGQFAQSTGSSSNAITWGSLGGNFLALLPANGSTDGTSINTALTALGANGGMVKLVPGSTYVIDTAVAIPSNCTLDISGARLTRGGSYTSGPLIQNVACTPQRTVTDAAITAGTNILNSATANFTAADVGQPVQILGAGVATVLGNVHVPLYATIAAVNSTTQVTLQFSFANTAAANAVATVSGATCRIFRRDTNIEILGDPNTFIHGGTNNHAGDTGSVTDPQSCFASNITLRRITGLRLDLGMTEIDFMQGVCMMNVGDLDDFHIGGIRFNCYINNADGVHSVGPLRNGVIERLTGRLFDNPVYLGTADWPPFADVSGEVQNIKVRDVQLDESGADMIYVAGGYYSTGDIPLQTGVKVERVGGTTATQPAGNGGYGVRLANVAGGSLPIDVWPGFSWQTDIEINDVSVVPKPQGGGAPGGSILLAGSGMGDVTVDGVYWNGPSGTVSAQQPVILVQSTTAPMVLRVKDVVVASNDYIDVVQVNASAFEWLSIDGLSMGLEQLGSLGGSTKSPNIVSVVGNAAGPAVVSIRNVFQITSDSGGRFFYYNSTANFNTGLIEIQDFFSNNGRALVELNTITSGQTPNIVLANGTVLSSVFGCLGGISANVAVRGLQFGGQSSPFVRNTYNTPVTWRLLPSNDCTFTSVSKLLDATATGLLALNGAVQPGVDISTLTPQDGDMAYNSNGALSCGTGVAIFHTGGTGHGWKNLYSGSTY